MQLRSRTIATNIVKEKAEERPITIENFNSTIKTMMDRLPVIKSDISLSPRQRYLENVLVISNIYEYIDASVFKCPKDIRIPILVRYDPFLKICFKKGIEWLREISYTYQHYDIESPLSFEEQKCQLHSIRIISRVCDKISKYYNKLNMSL